MTAVVIVLSVVVAVLAVLVAGLLRAYAEVLRKLHELGAGQPATSPFKTLDEIQSPAVHPVASRSEWQAAHDVSGQTLDGQVAVIPVTGVGHDTLIAFLSCGCVGCEGFWTELRSPGGVPLPPNVRLIVVTKSPEEERISELARLAPSGADIVMSSDTWQNYDVPGSPYVVIVNGPTGRVKGEGSGQSFQQMSLLVKQAMGDASGPLNRKPNGDVERESDVDRELLRAGIGPGHPSLYGGTDQR